MKAIVSDMITTHPLGGALLCRNAAESGSCRGPAPRPPRRGIPDLRRVAPPSPTASGVGRPVPRHPLRGVRQSSGALCKTTGLSF